MEHTVRFGHLLLNSSIKQKLVEEEKRSLLKRRPVWESRKLPDSRSISSAKHRKSTAASRTRAVSRNPAPSLSVLLEPQAAV